MQMNKNEQCVKIGISSLQLYCTLYSMFMITVITMCTITINNSVYYYNAVMIMYTIIVTDIVFANYFYKNRMNEIIFIASLDIL